MDIGEIKKSEMQEIIDFYYHIKEYGHIYHYSLENLDAPFKKILDGISEVIELMYNSYEM